MRCMAKEIIDITVILYAEYYAIIIGKLIVCGPIMVI